MLKKLATIAFAAGLSAIAATASAQSNPGYTVLDQPVSHDTADGKVLVQEVFWYGCPHCYALEPDFEQWASEQPDDIDVERLPGTMGRNWVTHARAYYTAEDLGILDQTHKPFFDAIHKNGQPLDSDAAIAKFYADYGVSEQQAQETLESFGVKSQVNQAHAQMRAYQLMGVPAIVIDGTYVITPSTAGGLTNMLTVADQVIERVRSEQASN
ncbi:thiol:disulfide interchange protein DsbA/DsbL [Halotalea alkalilenta]|uniref:thiol:disulfide interchange protein DsbA/DsbL n=1 Tax=Halotalea alkalilenta TaxID=376489 RepID=UPI0005BA2254|nr:thiol:disulfide interchange protein DsbA/DsbL [Halotalea alkalilenta]